MSFDWFRKTQTVPEQDAGAQVPQRSVCVNAQHACASNNGVLCSDIEVYQTGGAHW